MSIFAFSQLCQGRPVRRVVPRVWESLGERYPGSGNVPTMMNILRGNTILAYVMGATLKVALVVAAFDFLPGYYYQLPGEADGSSRNHLFSPPLPPSSPAFYSNRI